MTTKDVSTFLFQEVTNSDTGPQSHSTRWAVLLGLNNRDIVHRSLRFSVTYAHTHAAGAILVREWPAPAAGQIGYL